MLYWLDACVSVPSNSVHSEFVFKSSSLAWLYLFTRKEGFMFFHMWPKLLSERDNALGIDAVLAEELEEPA